MARLKHPQSAPPGNWVYRQNETGFTAKGDSLLALVAEVIKHRKYRNLGPVDELTVRLEVERQICTRLGLRDCKAEPGDDWVPVPDRPLATLANVLSFSRAAIEWIAGGRELVPVEEAKRRRDICLNCPLNAPVSGCRCARFYKIVAQTVPAERRFDGLHVCGICECANQVKVNLPSAVLEASNEGRNFKWPVHCWQKP